MLWKTKMVSQLIIIKELMIYQYCHSSHKVGSTNAEKVKPRYNSTYTHTRIFYDSEAAQEIKPKQASNYNYHFVQSNQAKSPLKTQIHQQKPFQSNDDPVNKRQARKEAQAQINPLNTDKKEVFSSLVYSNNYSRDRKLADLSSSNIFGGYYINPISKPIPPIPKEQPAANISKKQEQKLAIVENAQDLDESLKDSLENGRAQSVQQKRNMDNPNRKKKFRPVKLRWVKEEGHSASWQPSETSVTVYDEKELDMYISPHRPDRDLLVHYDYEDEEPAKAKEVKPKVKQSRPNTAAKKTAPASAAKKGSVQKKK